MKDVQARAPDVLARTVPVRLISRFGLLPNTRKALLSQCPTVNHEFAARHVGRII